MTTVDVKHFHVFCGLGGGAKGFNQGYAKVGQSEAVFRCLGGIDVDSKTIRDFDSLAGVKGTVLDLFTRDQYINYHGNAPPPEWREATPADIRRAAGNERPHIVFTSPPCKGLSALLNKKLASSIKYQALNELTVRGIWLSLEAWSDDPPEFFILENVPRITTRGAHLLSQIESLLHQYGYATAPTQHDCGELGGLGQRRKRFLLVARHIEKVPPFLYEPEKKSLRTAGDVLHRFPLPGDAAAGPMHLLPHLQWKTWVRLALINAGADWRALQNLTVVDGQLADYGIIPKSVNWQSDILGVQSWNNASATITTRGTASCGRFSVADPRFFGQNYSQYGLLHWGDTSGTVTGQSAPGGGKYSIADPRLLKPKFQNIYKVVDWKNENNTPSRGNSTSSRAFNISDPRWSWPKSKSGSWANSGFYGVIPFNNSSYAITGNAKIDTGNWSVADPRPPSYSNADVSLPDQNTNMVAVIEALDNTWHRPFTTLELAALQGLVEPEEYLELHGVSDKAWRERIGNAVPPPAAAAIASVMGKTLLLAMQGETFSLNSLPIWVQPTAVALSVEQRGAVL